MSSPQSSKSSILSLKTDSTQKASTSIADSKTRGEAREKISALRLRVSYLQSNIHVYKIIML